MLKSIFYKNEAFVEEQEWRMIVNYAYDCSMLASYGAEGKKHNLPKPVFEIRNGKIKSHIEFDFKEHFNKGIIKEIMIGSKAEFSESDLKMYLATKGITDIKVTTTKATYR